MEEKESKNKIVSFRLEEDNYQKLKNYCDINNESISDFLKKNVLDLIEKEKNPELKELKRSLNEFLEIYPYKYNLNMLLMILEKLYESDVKKIINDFEFKDKLIALIFNDLLPDLNLSDIKEKSFYVQINEIWDKTLGSIKRSQK